MAVGGYGVLPLYTMGTPFFPPAATVTLPSIPRAPLLSASLPQPVNLSNTKGKTESKDELSASLAHLMESSSHNADPLTNLLLDRCATALTLVPHSTPLE